MILHFNPEKLLSLNSIFHICNKLPKSKEKILKIINRQQNTNINYEDLSKDINDNSQEKNELNNLNKSKIINIIFLINLNFIKLIK